MNNAEYTAQWLESRGITHVFELIGGMITFMLDALEQKTNIKIISMHHEQGASFAAEGWARLKGTPGVAMATSGPGATNLITAIGSCYFDSVPTIFITGQVNRHEQKGERAIRQLGFQETDIVSMVKHITKAAWLVNDPMSLPRILDEAFCISTSGRPGPVLIDIPMDVQRFGLPEGTIVLTQPVPKKPSMVKRRGAFLQDLQKKLTVSKRPLILAGGGIRSAVAGDSFLRFVNKLNIPVVHSLMGVDVLSADHPLRFGLIGSYGNRWTNLGLSKSDLILVLGSRLDIRQTGSDLEGFRGQRKFFHVDCDEGELNNRVEGCTILIDELDQFLKHANTNWTNDPFASDHWLYELNILKNKWPDTKELKNIKGINPNLFIKQLSSQTPWARTYVADVGQHQMWAAQSIQLSKNQRFLTSGGMGAMGFALPAAIGAAFAGGATVMIAGDGGFQLNIQELQTIKRNKLPIKMIILNNKCHGMVRQFQEAYFEGRYQSTLWGYDAPSFVAIAMAYGISASSVVAPSDVISAISRLIEIPNEPYLLEVILDTHTNAYPKLAFGRAFGEMEPQTKPIDMEST
jgi:acetolactate synthase-1/2/3 large subunit